MEREGRKESKRITIHLPRSLDPLTDSANTVPLPHPLPRSAPLCSAALLVRYDNSRDFDGQILIGRCLL